MKKKKLKKKEMKNRIKALEHRVYKLEFDMQHCENHQPRKVEWRKFKPLPEVGMIGME